MEYDVTMSLTIFLVPTLKPRLYQKLRKIQGKSEINIETKPHKNLVYMSFAVELHIEAIFF